MQQQKAPVPYFKSQAPEAQSRIIAVLSLWSRLSIRDIARDLDISTSTVQGIARQMGLPVRPVAHTPGDGPRQRYTPSPAPMVDLTCLCCGVVRHFKQSEVKSKPRLSDLCYSCAKNRPKPRRRAA